MFMPLLPAYMTPIIVAISNRKKTGKMCCCSSTWQQKCGIFVAMMLALAVAVTLIRAMR